MRHLKVYLGTAAKPLYDMETSQTDDEVREMVATLYGILDPSRLEVRDGTRPRMARVTIFVDPWEMRN